MRQVITLLILISVLFSCDLLSQESNELKPYMEQRRKISLKGMRILRTWSFINIGSGILGGINSSGSVQYFHQMNAFWGGANLLISSVAIRSVKREVYPTDRMKLELDQKKLERTFLFSSGLDAAFVGAGFGLLNWSKAENVQQERLEGYAYSFILQGAFLFACDATLYWLHRRNRKKNLLPKSRDGYYMN